MKIFNPSLFTAISALALAGCSSINVKDNLVTLDKGYFSSSNEKVETSTAHKDEYGTLAAAYEQIQKPPSHTKDVAAESTEQLDRTQPLPSYLASDPLIKKLVTVGYDALVEGKQSTDKITEDDILTLTKTLTTVLNTNDGGGTITPLDRKKSIHKIITAYLTAYYSDLSNGFVDREGHQFIRPTITNSIGNDVITAVLRISLEGFFEGILHSPVYVDKNKKFLTINGREPSAHKYANAKEEPIVAFGKTGIDNVELKAIRYLSGFASDQSKTLASIAYKSFGGINVGFIIGGKFSVGDNDTVASLIDTTFEVTAKRLSEAVARRGFEKINIPDDTAAKHLLNDLKDSGFN